MSLSSYLEDLKTFKTVIMGRHTYEFCYAYGLKPGQPAYPHMHHYIFSETLDFENQSDQVTLCNLDLNIIRHLKQSSETDIYLCGGGRFAEWLLDHEMIDLLKVKLNPVIIGDGIRLFGSSKKQSKLELLDSQLFEDGLTINTYQINYV